VSGTGKTTLARALADRLGYAFIEGDDLHPEANVRKMASGVPLDDADRWPWLERVAGSLDAAAAAGGGVVACSALKRQYRDMIRERLTVPLAVVHPVLSRDALEARLRERRGHYMPVSLLASQFGALEPPDPDEDAIVIDAGLPEEDQIIEAVAALTRP
jgi:gluconokinase